MSNNNLPDPFSLGPEQQAEITFVFGDGKYYPSNRTKPEKWHYKVRGLDGVERAWFATKAEHEAIAPHAGKGVTVTVAKDATGRLSVIGEPPAAQPASKPAAADGKPAPARPPAGDLTEVDYLRVLSRVAHGVARIVKDVKEREDIDLLPHAGAMIGLAFVGADKAGCVKHIPGPARVDQLDAISEILGQLGVNGKPGVLEWMQKALCGGKAITALSEVDADGLLEKLDNPETRTLLESCATFGK